MKLILAPMEGLADAPLRDLLTCVGGFDCCVSEFIRVTNSLLSAKYFLRKVPELLTNARTASGVHIAVQLLGSDPSCMADNALRVALLGAGHIDLNFGCPAPTVNKHRGGAALLEEPELIRQIVFAVRKALPDEVVLSAKMRLGLRNTEYALDCAMAIAEAGASELTVHARTKVEGYAPPAHWEWISKIREAVKIPIIANGEVWTLEDYCKIRKISACEDVMLGRGAIADPSLARQIHAFNRGDIGKKMQWLELNKLIAKYFANCSELAPEGHYAVARLKQWLRLLARNYPQAEALFIRIRSQHEQKLIANLIDKFVELGEA